MGHDERFARLNGDSTATCEDADRLKSLGMYERLRD